MDEEETHIDLRMPENPTNEDQRKAMNGLTRVLSAFSNTSYSTSDINIYHRDILSGCNPHFVNPRFHEKHALLPDINTHFDTFSCLVSETAKEFAKQSGFLDMEYARLKCVDYISLADIETILGILPTQRYYSVYQNIHTRKIAFLVYRTSQITDVVFCCLVFFMRVGVEPVPPPFLYPGADFQTKAMQMFFINCVCRPGAEIAKNIKNVVYHSYFAAIRKNPSDDPKLLPCAISCSLFQWTFPHTFHHTRPAEISGPIQTPHLRAAVRFSRTYDLQIS